MKLSNISLFLVPVFLFGCASPGPKVSTTGKSDAWATFFPPEVPAQMNQYQLSYEVGLHQTATPVLPAFIDCSPPQQSRIVEPSIDLGRRDMTLIDDANPPPVNLK
jgi:hypothetical protein